MGDNPTIRQEDALRLHVLLARSEAIRIDESAMVVYGLSEDGEHSVKLDSRRGPDDRYLRAVRSLLSSHAMDSPGGYPVFLNRWTRMGQLDSTRLATLLKLGEPEAVIAVACARGLTPELARLAWWALPEAETARFLLEHESIRRDSLSGELSEFLVEHLPFETTPIVIADTVRLVLLASDVPDDRILTLWQRGQRKTSILLGFVKAMPFALPDTRSQVVSTEPRHSPTITSTLEREKAEMYSRLASHRGRVLFETCGRILERPADQDIVVHCLDSLARILEPMRPDCGACDTIEAITDNVERAIAEIGDTGSGHHGVGARLRAMIFLSMTGEPLVRDYFARSSTVGSLMRKQLAPILDPVSRQLRIAARPPDPD